MKEKTQVRIAKAINFIAAGLLVLAILGTVAAAGFILVVGFISNPWTTGIFLLGVPTFIYLAWKIGDMIRWSERVLYEYKNKKSEE